MVLYNFQEFQPQHKISPVIHCFPQKCQVSYAGCFSSPTGICALYCFTCTTISWLKAVVPRFDVKWVLSRSSESFHILVGNAGCKHIFCGISDAQVVWNMFDLVAENSLKKLGLCACFCWMGISNHCAVDVLTARSIQSWKLRLHMC